MSLAAAGCIGDGSIEVEGRVLNHAAEPIAGARVSLEIPERMGTLETGTAVDGEFHLFDLVAPGDYAIPLVVKAKGYKTARLDIRTSRENRVQVTLSPTGSVGASTIAHSPEPGRH
ncbi:MAG: carboxypeptidase regulatory-like domain-containing protein [Xanthomonadaceae bacterium]|nr:carboxypeptidase regulatory-like domain-containing protein [Xanthomonadaceae bacterium]